MSDFFASPKRRLDRADNRIRRLNDIIGGFFKDHPYTISVEKDADGVTEIHSLKLSGTLPADLEDLTAEALLALRSCLDQAGYAAAVASGKVLPKSTYFPITKGVPADLDNLIKGQCKDIPEEIRTLFRGFNAHDGGNTALCTLNEMRNAVHTIFAPTVMFSESTSVLVKYGVSPFQISNSVWDSAKNQIEFLRIGPGGHVTYEAEFVPNVAFAEVKGVERVPVVNVLYTMWEEVGRVLAATEAECRRIGLIG